MRCLMLIFMLVPGCRNDAAPPEPGPLPALERDTGHRWTVRWHRDLPTVAWLEGSTRPLALTAAEALHAGRGFLFRYPDLFALARDELDDGEVSVDELGMIHVRFTQRHGHLPVWGTEVRLHFARDGTLLRVHGRSLPVGEPELIPARTAAEARVTALLDARGQRPD